MNRHIRDKITSAGKEVLSSCLNHLMDSHEIVNFMVVGRDYEMNSKKHFHIDDDYHP